MRYFTYYFVTLLLTKYSRQKIQKWKIVRINDHFYYYYYYYKDVIVIKIKYYQNDSVYFIFIRDKCNLL